MSLSYYEEIKFSNSQDNFNITREQQKLDQIKGIPKLLETLNRNIQDIDSKLNSTRGKSQTLRMHTIQSMQECSDLKNIVKQSVEGLSDIFNLKLNKGQLTTNNNGSLKNVNNPLAFEVIKEEPLHEVNRYDNDFKPTKQEKTGTIKKPKTNSKEAVVKNTAATTLTKRDSGKVSSLKMKTGDLSFMNHDSNATNPSYGAYSNTTMQNNYMKDNPVNYSNKINKHKSTLEKNIVKKTINTTGTSRVNKKNVNVGIPTSTYLNTYGNNTDVDNINLNQIRETNNNLTKNIQMLKEKIENKLPPQNIPHNIPAPTLNIPLQTTQNIQVPNSGNNKKTNSNINNNINITNESNTPVQQSLNNYNIVSKPVKESISDNILNKNTSAKGKNVNRDKSSFGRYDNMELEDKPLENLVLKPITEKEFDNRSKSPIIKNYKLKPRVQESSDNNINNTSAINKTVLKKGNVPESVPENYIVSSNYMSEAKLSNQITNKKSSNNTITLAKRKSSISRNSNRDEYSSKHSNDNIPNEFYVNTVENNPEVVNNKIAKFLEENAGFNINSFLRMNFIINELVRYKSIQGFDEKLLSSDYAILLASLFNNNSDESAKKNFEEKKNKYDIKKVTKIQTHWRKHQVKKILETKKFNFKLKNMKNPSCKDRVQNYLINKIDENPKLKKLNSILLSCVDEFNKLITSDKSNKFTLNFRSQRHNRRLHGHIQGRSHLQREKPRV
jgi:hypothetical protein